MRKTLLFIIIGLVAAGLLAGCGPADEAPAGNESMNETVPEEQEEAPAGELETIEEVPEEAEVILEPETPEPLPEPTELDIEKLDLELREIAIYRTDFGEKEVYEMGMLLATDKHARITGAELHFTPDCYEEVTMLITINDQIVYREALTCGEEHSLAFDHELLLAGKNMIALHNHVTKPYELQDIVLVFTYDDGEVEPLAAEDYFFMASDDEEESFRTLGGVALMNTVTQTFNLKEGQLTQDLYLELEAPGTEGELTILLNEYEVYQGVPNKRDNRVLLPLQYLVMGKNTLTFVGTP